MSDYSPKLLLDVHTWEGLTDALRERGFNVVHANHVGYREAEDEDLLALSTADSRAILTYNHQDFVPLARRWFAEGKDHGEVILSIQLTRGALLHQTEKLLRFWIGVGQGTTLGDIWTAVSAPCGLESKAWLLRLEGSWLL